MLSQQDNETLTRVGPGTPMGELLRRFWMPALLEDEVAAPDGDPVRLRLLGEDLVAFRDTQGRVGILDAYCPHRMAHLYFGRNEECGLRCVYHGWKFDVDGNCVDQPSEPGETNFARKVTLTSYPTAVRGGVVWVYMGPKDKMPALPDFEWSYLPPTRRIAVKRQQYCNWAQAVEGGIDSSHISYLHRGLDRSHPVNKGMPGGRLSGEDRHPVFDVREVEHGLLIGARRELKSENKHYWRITPFLLPFYTMIPGGMRDDDNPAPYFQGHAWVPIDDENTWTWSFGANPGREMTQEERDFFGGRENYWGPVDERYQPRQNRANDYGLDREVQRVGNYTGIKGIPNQDAAVQESMGPIVPRWKEHLGSSDSAIIQWRKLMLRLVRELQRGKEPDAPHHGEWYNVRSVSVVIDPDADWQQGAEQYRHGGTIAKHAAE